MGSSKKSKSGLENYTSLQGLTPVLALTWGIGSYLIWWDFKNCQRKPPLRKKKEKNSFPVIGWGPNSSFLGISLLLYTVSLGLECQTPTFKDEVQELKRGKISSVMSLSHTNSEFLDHVQ